MPDPKKPLPVVPNEYSGYFQPAAATAVDPYNEHPSANVLGGLLMGLVGNPIMSAYGTVTGLSKSILDTGRTDPVSVFTDMASKQLMNEAILKSQGKETPSPYEQLDPTGMSSIIGSDEPTSRKWGEGIGNLLLMGILHKVGKTGTKVALPAEVATEAAETGAAKAGAAKPLNLVQQAKRLEANPEPTANVKATLQEGDTIPSLDPDVAVKQTYPSRQAASDAINATGKRGMPVQLGKRGQWGIVYGVSSEDRVLQKKIQDNLVPTGVQGVTPIQGKFLIAALDKNGNVQIHAGDQGNLSQLYNGWKNSGDLYPRLASGKVTKAMTQESVIDRIAKQFGVTPDKVQFSNGKPPAPPAVVPPVAPTVAPASLADRLQASIASAATDKKPIVSELERQIAQAPKTSAPPTPAITDQYLINELKNWTLPELKGRLASGTDPAFSKLVQQELDSRNGGKPPIPPQEPPAAAPVTPAPKPNGPVSPVQATAPVSPPVGVRDDIHLTYPKDATVNAYGSVGKVLTTGPFGVRVKFTSGRMVQEQGAKGYFDVAPRDINTTTVKAAPVVPMADTQPIVTNPVAKAKLVDLVKLHSDFANADAAYGALKDKVRAGKATTDELRDAGGVYGRARQALNAGLKQAAEQGQDVDPAALKPTEQPSKTVQGPSRPVGRPKKIVPETPVASDVVPEVGNETATEVDPSTVRDKVTVDTSTAKSAADIRSSVLAALNDYKAKVDAANKTEGTPQPATLELTIPNGPTYTINSTQIADAIKQFSSGEAGSAFQGIVDKVKQPTQRQQLGYSAPGSNKSVIAGANDADALDMGHADIMQHDELVGPTAATKEHVPNAVRVTKINLADIPKDVTHYIYRQDPDGTASLLVGDEESLNRIASQKKNAIGGSKLRVYAVAEGHGRTLQDAVKKNVDAGKLDLNKLSVGFAGDKTPIQPLTETGTSGPKLPGAAGKGFAEKPESGAVDPELAARIAMHIAGGFVGAMGGGLVGSSEDDKKRDALIGAIGGLLAPSIIKNPMLIAKYRAMGMLSNPITVLVKALGDQGAILGEAAEGSWARKDLGYGKNLLKNFYSKETLRTIKDVFNNPDEANEEAEKYAQAPLIKRGPLSWGPRALGALTEGTQDAIMRARSDLTPQEAYKFAKDLTFGGTPANKYMSLLASVPSKGWAGSASMPFARIAANLYEKGLERTPFGVKQLGEEAYSSPEMRRRVMIRAGAFGPAAMLLGYMTAPDSNDDSVTTKWAKRLGGAALGPYVLPFELGAILHEAVHNGRNTDVGKVTTDFLNTSADRMPLPKSIRPVDWLRTLLVPSGVANATKWYDQNINGVEKRKTNGDILDPIAQDIPFLRQQLPEPVFDGRQSEIDAYIKAIRMAQKPR